MLAIAACLLGHSANAAVPAQLSPANGASSVSVNVLLDWASLSGATGYDYQVYQGGTLVASNTNGPIASTYVRLTLDYATTYQWRVRGRVLPQNNPWSGYWSFTTENVPMPVILSPTSGAQIDGTSVTLSWSSVSVADGYDFEVRAGSTVVAGYGINYSGGPWRPTSVTLNLPAGTAYTARVRPRVLVQNNPWTAEVPFTVMTDAPVIVSPANGSTVPFNVGQVRFTTGVGTWVSLRLTDLSVGALIHSADHLTGTSASLPALEPGTSYRLQLQAWNAVAGSRWVTADFQAGGVDTPLELSMPEPEEDEYLTLTASPVAGATRYDFVVQGPQSGLSTVSSATPSATVLVTDDAGSWLDVSVTARSLRSASAPRKSRVPVKKAAPKPKWRANVEVQVGTAVSVNLKCPAGQQAVVQKYQFGAWAKDDFVPSPAFAVTYNGGVATLSLPVVAQTDSGLYQVKFKRGRDVKGITRFFLRVREAMEPGQAIELKGPPGSSPYVGLQLVGASKMGGRTYDWLTRNLSGGKSGLNVEIELLPVTFYNPLESGAKGVAGAVQHPMAAGSFVAHALAARKGANLGQWRLEIDLLFNHSTSRDYSFTPGSSAAPVPFRYNLDYNEFRPSSGETQPRGGSFYQETLRRTDMLADLLWAMSTDATLRSHTEGVVMNIELEDEVDSSTGMSEAYQAVVSRLASRGIGKAFPIPVWFRRVTDNAGRFKDRLDGKYGSPSIDFSLSHEHHQCPVKKVAGKAAFDPTLISGLLERGGGPTLTAGDAHSTDGDGGISFENNEGETSVGFSTSQVRQIYGLRKGVSETGRYPNGLLHQYLNKGIALKLWRFAMNAVSPEDKTKSPRLRKPLAPFGSTAEATLVADFFQAAVDELSRSAQVVSAPALLARTDGPVTAALRLDGELPPAPALDATAQAGVLCLCPRNLPAWGMLLQHSDDLSHWQTVSYIAPGCVETSFHTAGPGQGFFRLMREVSAPAAPASLSAGLDAGVVTLEWPACAGACLYQICRRTAGQAWVMLDSCFEDGTCFADTPGAQNALVEYAVMAGNTAGASVLSPVASVWIPQRPPVPSGLTAGLNSSGAVVLNWQQDPLQIADAIIVERANGDGLFETIASVSDATVFEDAVPPSGTLWYRVHGRNQGGDGPVSVVVMVQVP